MSETQAIVADAPTRERYEIVMGDQVAVLEYRQHGDHVILVHTEVPEPLRERGLGGMLARHALDEARRAGQKVVVKCPFVTTWLRRHHEYDDIVVARVVEDAQADPQPPGEPR